MSTAPIDASAVLARRGAARRARTWLRGRSLVGLLLVAVVLTIAILGPFVTPHSPDEPIGLPGQAPSPDALFGTDFLGRDVLSRLLTGGARLLLLAVVASALTYLVGVSLGMLAGWRRSVADPLVMRSVDIVLSFPPILLLLVLMGSAGTGNVVIIIGVVLVVAPGVIRIVRTATLTVASRGYVEAAIARGEPTAAILRREILPSVLPVAVADFGIRFGASLILIASLNYLGLGANPPDANWALMVSENRAVMSTNVWAVMAPGILIGVLTVAVNLIGDGYIARLGRSGDLR